MTPRIPEKNELQLFWREHAKKLADIIIIDKKKIKLLNNQITQLDLLTDLGLKTSQLKKLSQPIRFIKIYLDLMSILLKYAKSQNALIALENISDTSNKMKTFKNQVLSISKKHEQHLSNSTSENPQDDIFNSSVDSSLRKVEKHHASLKLKSKNDIDALYNFQLVSHPMELLENLFNESESTHYSQLESLFNEQKTYAELTELINMLQLWATSKHENLTKLSIIFDLVESIKQINFLIIHEDGNKSPLIQRKLLQHLVTINCHEKKITEKNKKINQLHQIIKTLDKIKKHEKDHLERIIKTHKANLEKATQWLKKDNKSDDENSVEVISRHIQNLRHLFIDINRLDINKSVAKNTLEQLKTAFSALHPDQKLPLSPTLEKSKALTKILADRDNPEKNNHSKLYHHRKRSSSIGGSVSESNAQPFMSPREKLPRPNPTRLSRLFSKEKQLDNLERYRSESQPPVPAGKKTPRSISPYSILSALSTMVSPRKSSTSSSEPSTDGHQERQVFEKK